MTTATVEKPADPAEFLPTEQRRKRGDGWLVTVLAVAAALVLGGLLMIFTDSTVQADLGYVVVARKP